MAKIFPLLKHKSLGPGVVLRNPHDGTVDCYFSDGLKRIVVDHPYVEKWDLSITDFIKNQLYDGIFDAYLKEKAKKYIDSDHIQLVDIGDDIINARVKGTKTYNVSISLSNSRLSFTCDCPVQGLCKHMYAVCAYVYKEKIYKPRRESDKPISNSKKEDPLLTMLNSYLYYQRSSFDFISFYRIFDYLNDDKNDLVTSLKSIYQLYSRSQYQLRVMQLLLYPSYLNKEFHAKIDKIHAESPQNDFSSMLSDLQNYENTNQFNKVKELPWYKVALDYLNATFSKDISYFSEAKIKYGFESDYYLTNLLRYLKIYDLSVEDISKLNHSHTFKNYLYVIRSKMSDEMYQKGYVKYLFLSIMNETQLNDKNIPINLLIEYIKENDNPKLIPVFDSRFNEIEEKDYIYIADAICKYMFLSFVEKMKYEDIYLSLANKLPNNQYLVELVNHQRRKKARI